MSHRVTTADVLESVGNVVYAKAQDSLAAALAKRGLLDGVDAGDRGRLAFEFATDALSCLNDAGRVSPGIGTIAATVYCLETLCRIVDLGLPPAKRIGAAFRAKRQAQGKPTGDGYAEAASRAKELLRAALFDYLDGRCPEGDGLPA
jgi:hypothetical protein